LISSCHSFVRLAETACDKDAPNFDILEINTCCNSLSNTFMYQIQHLMDILQVLGVAETPRLVNLLSQLDFNRYYVSIAPKPQFLVVPLVPPVPT
jgi:hypothetical protein